MSPEIRVFVPNWAKVPISTGSANAVLTTDGSMPAWSTNIYVGSGTLGVNTAVAPATTFQVIDTSAVTPRGICHDQYNTGTNSAQINTRKARGTPTVPTTIVTGDILGRHLFWGHDGTAFIESANIRATSSGTIATNRVPSQLEFYTSTNAAPSVLTLGLTLNSAQQTLLTDGSAAAPSLSFSSDTDTGFFSAGANTIGVSVGTANILTLSNASGARLREPTNNSTLELLSAGGINLTANGTNQNITLTPSGTGTGIISYTNSGTTTGGLQVKNNSAISGPSASLELTTPSAANASDRNWGFQTNNALHGALQILRSGSNSGSAFSGGSTTAIFSGNGNLLLGGLTTDGTGVLQFPATITSAGGITFGTDLNIFRLAAGYLAINNTAGDPTIRFQNSGVDKANFGISSGTFYLYSKSGALTLGSNDTLAFTLDSSQNAAFVGTLKSSGFARVTGDVTNATATMSNLTNLSVTVASGTKYVGTIQIFANDSTGADGLAFDLGGGAATFTDLEFGFTAQPTGATLGTVTSTTSTTAITLTVVSTSDAVYTVSFGFTCNAGGTLIPRFAQNSHSAGTATVRKNSSMVLLASSN